MARAGGGGFTDFMEGIDDMTPKELFPDPSGLDRVARIQRADIRIGEARSMAMDAAKSSFAVAAPRFSGTDTVESRVAGFLRYQSTVRSACKFYRSAGLGELARRASSLVCACTPDDWADFDAINATREI